jgi:cytochrome P450
VQSELRSKLRSALTTVATENRNPSAQEIIKIQIPYLDACMEEIIRCSLTSPALQRVAIIDTEILGHRIPKGTEVFLMANGPSIFSAPFKVDEKLRSQSCRVADGRIRSWDPEDMSSFKPKRWLVRSKGEGEKEVFDAAAGPHLAFGLGPRGCYGRKLAYIELKFMLVLIIWNFELQKLPEKLSGYDAVDKLTHQPQQCYVRLARAQ